MLKNIQEQNLALEAEIQAEKAAAYLRQARRMESCLAALRDFDTTKSELSPAERASRREDLVAEAAEQVWYFVIQREAMRLPMPQELYGEFGIPEEVRLRMGPKKRRETKS